MSLAIEVDEITAVLLADGWHEVDEGSFELDSYEYAWEAGNTMLHRGGQSGVCANGFEFRGVDGHRIAGPLTAILAVRRNAR